MDEVKVEGSDMKNTNNIVETFFFFMYCQLSLRVTASRALIYFPTQVTVRPFWTKISLFTTENIHR